MNCNVTHATSKGILNNPVLPVLLGSDIKPIPTDSSEVTTIVCWGYKETTKKAIDAAERLNAKIIRLEDGFLTQIPNTNLKLSICSDSSGMHYSLNSDIHDMCLREFTDEEIERAKDAIDYKNTNYITKYNKTCVTQHRALCKNKKYVLIADQVSDDESVKHSNATLETFKTMIEDALMKHPEHTLIINCHPDSKKKTFSSILEDSYKSSLLDSGRVKFLSSQINAIQLVKDVDIVYTISSLIGFEAALLRKKVLVYGNPFYSGYGFTEDVYATFKVSKSIEAVFHSAYIDYCTYINPFTLEKCELEDVLELAKANMSYFPEKHIVIKTPSKWKRPFLKKYLSRNSIFPVIYHDEFFNAEWSYSKDSNAKYSIEDGFVRSTGLGSSHIAPRSLVIDEGGIYYDYKSNSKLQKILNTQDFTKRDIQRAEYIIDYLVKHKLSKYNLGHNSSKIPIEPYIIVPGQVETDKSLIASGRGYKNADAVKAARQRHPNHTIVYRPHPDVVYNGIGDQDESIAQSLADITTSEGDIIPWIENADEVVTITSNSGFEALVRGVPVYCLGFPYYYGYGLTENEIAIDNRHRKITIKELVAGVLIHYPTYYISELQLFCRIEDAMLLLTNNSNVLTSKHAIDSQVNTRAVHFLSKMYKKLKKTITTKAKSFELYSSKWF